MTHVVQRCPSCGVEHEAAGASECEACGTALRSWCRRHGREIGWLEASVCSRCVEEAARPRPAPASPAATPAAPRRSPAKTSTTGRLPPGRSAREILRGAPAPSPGERLVPEEQHSVAYVIGEAIGVGIFGWFVGAVLGLIGGFVFGGDPMLVGAAVARLFGLGGLVVGGISGVAKRVANREKT